MEQPFRHLASISGLAVHAYAIRFQQHRQKAAVVESSRRWGHVLRHRERKQLLGTVQAIMAFLSPVLHFGWRVWLVCWKGLRAATVPRGQLFQLFLSIWLVCWTQSKGFETDSLQRAHFFITFYIWSLNYINNLKTQSVSYNLLTFSYIQKTVSRSLVYTQPYIQRQDVLLNFSAGLRRLPGHLFNFLLQWVRKEGHCTVVIT